MCRCTGWEHLRCVLFGLAFLTTLLALLPSPPSFSMLYSPLKITVLKSSTIYKEAITKMGDLNNVLTVTSSDVASSFGLPGKIVHPPASKGLGTSWPPGVVIKLIGEEICILGSWEKGGLFTPWKHCVRHTLILARHSDTISQDIRIIKLMDI